MKLLLKQIECLSFIRVLIIPKWLEHLNSDSVISERNIIPRWVPSPVTYEGALTFFYSAAYSNYIKNNKTVPIRHINYIKLRLSDPCLKMVRNVQCLVVKYTTNMTMDHIILIWFKIWNKVNGGSYNIK